jgi:hypothetical protein
MSSLSCSVYPYCDTLHSLGHVPSTELATPDNIYNTKLPLQLTKSFPESYRTSLLTLGSFAVECIAPWGQVMLGSRLMSPALATAEPEMTSPSAFE